MGGLPCEGKPFGGFSQKLHQLVIHYLYYLLTGGQASENLLSGGLFRYISHEPLCHLEVDIGLEKGPPHLPHGFGNVLLGKNSPAGQVSEGIAKPLGKLIKHGITPYKMRFNQITLLQEGTEIPPERQAIITKMNCVSNNG